MDRQTYPNPKVVNLASKFVPVKLDTDKPVNGKVAQKYGVSAIPAILFLDAKGKVVHRVEGFEPPDRFAGEMQTALKKAPK